MLEQESDMNIMLNYNNEENSTLVDAKKMAGVNRSATTSAKPVASPSDVISVESMPHP
jgi:hypothetical protein